MKKDWVKIPIELTKDVETIDLAINSLKFIKKVREGKYLTSNKGLVNKIKHYFLGFPLITDLPSSNPLLDMVDETTEYLKKRAVNSK